ncbi:GNAT family N-acetyltransferase [Adhaeribacter terreus]|uniref:GNAT family N-acetyltransferase n=1 Tax=Adhaeribacter terreus TaxID=529703 RepID=A0ABW0E9B3_9BACT
MEIKTLENTPTSEIVTCFNEAFSDYFVPISATEEAMQSRWRASRVDFSLSFGAFENNKLVAFIITGVGNLHGHKTAYNAGTGVIPAFRGQKLVAKLYAYALPVFKGAGISQCTLEVITQNEKAIKAYRNIGFEIDRTLHCFKGELQPASTPSPFEIKTSTAIDFEAIAPLQAYTFAWDNMNEGIKAAGPAYQYWQLFENQNLKAYLFLNPATGYIGQFGFDRSAPEIYGLNLLREVAKTHPSLRLNNVDANAVETLALFETAGMVNYISQFEMRMLLN